MSNIKKIRQKIENSIKAFEFNGGIYDSYEAGELSAYQEILNIIDSLPEEKPSEDLEEAAENLFETIEIQEHENIFEDTFKKIFIAGAERQKAKMMKDAVDYKIVNNLAAYPVIYYEVKHLGLKFGDKVKIIIVKNEE